jgi:hypothetical protein
MNEGVIEVWGSVRADLVEWLRSELQGCRTLTNLMAWMREQPRPLVSEIVTQDEYTHDVVVSYDPAAHLVFDAT